MEGRILIADDDKDIANLISDILEEEGLETEKVYTGIDALKKIQSGSFDIVLLDIMLPEINGFDVCKYSRDEAGCPILFITARNNSLDKVLGFELGADDYITKPFDNQELAARVKAHLRRYRNDKNIIKKEDKILRFKDIEADINSYVVKVCNKEIELSSREFQILVCLMKNSNSVLSREQIYEEIWGIDGIGDVNTVTVHIKRLREKVDKEGKCRVKKIKAKFLLMN